MNTNSICSNKFYADFCNDCTLKLVKRKRTLIYYLKQLLYVVVGLYQCVSWVPHHREESHMDLTEESEPAVSLG